ncbi:cache domain-containing protein [Sulfurimonas sp. HSL-1716]|uniref:sensor domain-containing diguanylate cyclase n=1 Tax=Hydrocurvibacter sulfurireducens TaxID=3131937 RepID=UPI0031F9E86C
MKNLLDFLSEKNLVSLIAYGPFIFIPFVITMISMFLLHLTELQYQDSLKDMETVYVEAQKNKTISKVDIASKLLQYNESVTTDILKEKLKNRVNTAYSIAKNIYDQNIKSHTKKEVQKIIIDSLRPLLWNNGESYIFIVDFNGISRLSPSYLRHFEGKSILDLQDAHKRYVVKEEIALAKEKNEGYLWDTFTRPNDDLHKQYKQLAYVKRFNHFNWYLGTAEYLDTTMAQMHEHSLNTLRNMFLNHSKYFFVIDKYGNNIMNGQDLFPKNTNILSLKDTDGKEFVKELIKSSDSKESYFVSYKLKNPLTGKVEEKFSYVKKVLGTDWIVGSGFYYNFFNDRLQKKAASLQEMYKKQYLRILFFSFVLIVLSLFVSYLISVSLKKRLTEYSKEIKEKNNELTNLNISLEKIVDERTQELHKAYHDMKEIAVKDALTKIYNRYFFNDALQKEINRSNRYDLSFSLCMFDIDNFKEVNDTYGHDVGDVVLKTVTEIVRKYLRSSDIFARYGGEEFMIILPKTVQETSSLIVERIRKSISEHIFEEVGHLTVSIGLVTYRKDETKEAFIKRADLALYNAKENGKNRIITDE